jgi:hypothetical protein
MGAVAEHLMRYEGNGGKEPKDLGAPALASPVQRLFVGLIVLAATMLLLSSVNAHRGDCGAGAEAALCHLTVNVQDLGPGLEHTYRLHSERVEGDFPEGWILTAFGGVQGTGLVLVNVSTDGETRHQWTWSGNRYSSNSTRLDRSGDYELRLFNPGGETVRYGFYFDQSCNCAAKLIPLNGGFVLFNYDLPADREVRLGFPTIEGWHLRGSLALLRNSSGEWPQDFSILQTAEQQGKGWLQFEFETTAAETHYVFIEALSGVTTGPNGQPRPVELTPLLEVAAAKTPGLGALAIVGLLAVAAVWRRA